MDKVSSDRLAQVHPKLRKTITLLGANLAAKGIEIRVLQGLRTKEEQDALYAQGRTAPGKIVTNARGGSSAHNFGYAVDMIPGVRGANPWEPNWKVDSADFQAMIEEAEKLGLVAGAHWKSIKDYDHFQLPGLPVTPTDEMRAALSAGGLQAFWAKFCPVTEDSTNETA